MTAIDNCNFKLLYINFFHQKNLLKNINYPIVNLIYSYNIITFQYSFLNSIF